MDGDGVSYNMRRATCRVCLANVIDYELRRGTVTPEIDYVHPDEDYTCSDCGSTVVFLTYANMYPDSPMKGKEEVNKDTPEAREMAGDEQGPEKEAGDPIENALNDGWEW